MKKFKLLDLNREFKVIKRPVMKKIESLISNGEFILGEETKLFENRFAKFCGVKHCIGVSSGTAALFLTLKACNISNGDEVITSSLTFTATAEAIVQVGATPVFVDVDEKALLIDTNLIESKITSKTKAIIAVHLAGMPANMDELTKLCDKRNILLIEDCSQSHGSKFKRKKVGSFGLAGCFSFMPAKNIGAYGDAGCVVTNDDNLAQTIKLLRNHGRVTKYEHKIIGYNERIDNVWAGVLNVKLNYLDKWNKNRNRIAKIYNTFLDKSLISIQSTPKNSYSSYYVFNILVKKNRDKIVVLLNKNGISTGVYYPIPLHLQECYSYLGYKKGNLKVTEQICNTCIAIPMHPFLTDSEAKYIAKKVNNLVREGYND